jgi:hypothetical protein
LINTVRCPTRITSSTESLIDIIIANRENPELRATVIDLGLSDHLAQIVRIHSEKGNKQTKTIVKRQFTDHGIEDFNNLLSQESWDEVVNLSDVNASLKAFVDIFLYFFNITFPYKGVKLREKKNKRWLSKGLIISSHRMKILNNLKRTYTLKRVDLAYINKYQRIYKKNIKGSKKKEIMIGS